MEKREINGRDVYYAGNLGAEFLLIQPIDRRSIEHTDEEYRLIADMYGSDDFLLVCVPVDNWNDDLSPWQAPPVIGSEGFGGKAADTLRFIEKYVVYTFEQYRPDTRPKRIIGGYSLAGLFALWAAYSSDAFAGAAGVSPSVWFPDWDKFIKQTYLKARYVYLSLGDREHNTKNAVMAAVRDRLILTDSLIDSADMMLDHTLEYNTGGHFDEPLKRAAKGFVWLMKDLQGKRMFKGGYGRRCCLVGDIADGGKDTKQFAVGERVYIAPFGNDKLPDKVTVIAKPKGSHKYIEAIVGIASVEDFRFLYTADPAVLNKMNSSKITWWGDSDADRAKIENTAAELNLRACK